MGSINHVTCNACGYRADVGGGREAGMLVTVQTMVCGDCTELVDVITVVHAFDPDDRAELESKLSRCPDCGGTRLTTWGVDGSAADPDARVVLGPCPKCGASVSDLVSFGIWD